MGGHDQELEEDCDGDCWWVVSEIFGCKLSKVSNDDGKHVRGNDNRSCINGAKDS